ncbi:phenylalanine--tRNA ligase beta subunit [Alphaproteobacteria bacterium]|nr:phenylalanine--tRNA ligase beta subunit [Alphaproteobacteria bacterium]
MKFTLSWLKRHLDCSATQQDIAEKLTMLGLEVESLDDPAARLSGFVVGFVCEAAPHPNADRLRLCRVDSGSGVLQVVCGAPNARAGIKVALATPGVVIPATGEVLKKGMVRGLESQGMMCSSRELGLSDDHEGIIELPADAPTGKSLSEAMAADPVFDISVTPNRADCLSVRGIARDLAAAGLGRLKPMSFSAPKESFKSPTGARLDLPQGAKEACPLFTGRMFRGLQNRQSPEWLQALLRSVGMRPISALVDVTNFILMDLGQPLHAFDASKVKGWIGPRLAADGETLAALNGKSYALSGAMTVVADEGGALSIAGVMGGESSAISDATDAVFLEAAWFDPLRTAQTGRALGLESESRYRFERGVDPAMVIPAMNAASAMILEICGGVGSEMLKAGEPPKRGRTIAFRPTEVERHCALAASAEECKAFLTALGCEIETAGEVLTVKTPDWRADIEGERDLIEEVVRLKGYDRIPSLSMPRPEIVRPILTPRQRRDGVVRRVLAERGLAQAVTWSFVSEAYANLFGVVRPELKLSNPISSDLSVMRPSLLPNLVAAIVRNADRGVKDPALFELGPQFDGDAERDQQQIAAGVRQGRKAVRHWAETVRLVDAFDAKADAIAAIVATGLVAESSLQTTPGAASWYHPGRSGALKLGAKIIAWFGEIHPRILTAMGGKEPMAAFELFLDRLPPPRTRANKAKPLLRPSPFQPIERDFAFAADAEVAADAVIRAAKGADKILISDVSLFDLYQGEHMEKGRKSLAIQVTLQPVDRTLTDAEIESASKKIVSAVTKATGAVLRS